MILFLVAALAFDQTPVADFSHHVCRASLSWMVPGACPDGSPGCVVRHDESAPCEVVSNADPAIPRQYVASAPALALGQLLTMCVAAVDTSGNESECVGSDP